MVDKDIINFPKIQCPFVRQDIDGKWKVTDKITPYFDWVFKDDGVIATDKLDGTNICCIFEQGILQCVDNRTNRLIAQPCLSANWRTDTYRVVEGVLQAMKRGWIDKFFTGRMYGELVGPTVNKNLHNLDMHLFVPFDYIKQHCHWKSWSANKYPKTFDSIKKWFEDLPSLFTKRITKQEGPAEGIVFYRKDGRMAKLRRDMF